MPKVVSAPSQTKEGKISKKNSEIIKQTKAAEGKKLKTI
jgi:hypothetical protein